MTTIYNLTDLQQIIESQPEQWRPLVFTNGCFDLLHTGHVRYLTALRAVDGVVLFSETTAINLIAALRPDIYVKGGDYALAQPLGTRIATLPEAATVLSYGGAIELIQVEIPTSTSDIIQTILGGATS
jgi:D-glycero-beta-D-manno-heptose 1-phosphate adenylyltransferase